VNAIREKYLQERSPGAMRAPVCNGPYYVCAGPRRCICYVLVETLESANYGSGGKPLLAHEEEATTM